MKGSNLPVAVVEVVVVVAVVKVVEIVVIVEEVVCATLHKEKNKRNGYEKLRVRVSPRGVRSAKRTAVKTAPSSTIPHKEKNVHSGEHGQHQDL